MKDLYEYDKNLLIYKKRVLTKKERVLKIVKNVILTIGIISLINQVLISSSFINVIKNKIELLIMKNEYNKINNKINESSISMNKLFVINENIYKALFNLYNITNFFKLNGSYTDNKYEFIKNFEESDLIKNTHKNIDLLLSKLKINSIFLNTFEDSLNQKINVCNFTPSINPIKIPYITSKTFSPFGLRIHPIYNILLMHEGIDISAKTGTAVYATADGYIDCVNCSNTGYGNHIIIDHKNGYETIYAHLSKIVVKKDQFVKRGEVIGLVGVTGNTTCEHLHYELRSNNLPINPENYFGDVYNYIK